MPFQATVEKEGKVKIPPDLMKGLGLKEGDMVSLDFVPMDGGSKPLKQVEAELAWAQEYKVAVDTLRFYLPTWLANFKENLPYFVKGAKSFVDIPPAEGVKRRCVVVANGPSFYDADLKNLKDFDGTVVSANKPLKKLLEHAVVPDWVTALDGDAVVLKSFDNDPVKDMADQLSFLLPTTVHPSVVKFLKKYGNLGRVYWANPHFSDEVAPNVCSTLTNITKIPSCEHGGNVGTFSYLLAVRPLYCNPIGLLGFDLSYRPDPKWTLEHASQYRHFYNPKLDDGKKRISRKAFYALTPPFEYYLARILDLWKVATEMGTVTYNLTPEGPLNAVIGFPRSSLKKFISV